MNFKTVSGVKRIGVAFAILVFILGSILVVYPFLSQSGRLSEDIAAAQNDQDAAQQRLVRADTDKKNAAKLLSLDNSLNVLLPANADVPGFSAFVAQAAEVSGVGSSNVTKISFGLPALVAAAGAPAGTPTPAATPPSSTTPLRPGETAGSGGDGSASGGTSNVNNLAQSSINITAKGNVSQLQSFVAQLSNGSRNLLITQFAITTSTEGSSEINITGTTFIYRSIQQPPLPK